MPALSQDQLDQIEGRDYLDIGRSQCQTRSAYHGSSSTSSLTTFCFDFRGANATRTRSIPKPFAAGSAPTARSGLEPKA